MRYTSPIIENMGKLFDDFAKEGEKMAKKLKDCEYCGQQGGEHKCQECECEIGRTVCQENHGLCSRCTWLSYK